jgi:hypothetical protein
MANKIAPVTLQDLENELDTSNKEDMVEQNLLLMKAVNFLAEELKSLNAGEVKTHEEIGDLSSATTVFIASALFCLVTTEQRKVHASDKDLFDKYVKRFEKIAEVLMGMNKLFKNHFQVDEAA